MSEHVILKCIRKDKKDDLTVGKEYEVIPRGFLVEVLEDDAGNKSKRYGLKKFDYEGKIDFDNPKSTKKKPKKEETTSKEILDAFSLLNKYVVIVKNGKCYPHYRKLYEKYITPKLYPFKEGYVPHNGYVGEVVDVRLHETTNEPVLFVNITESVSSGGKVCVLISVDGIKLMATDTATLKSISEEFKREENVTERKEFKKTMRKDRTKMPKKVTLREFLEGQGVPSKLVDDLSLWRKNHKLDQEVVDRVLPPSTMFLGGETWTMAITAILEGQNILLEGAKATGKNVLANNLAFAFGRPIWDVSFHTNIDVSILIGSDTYRNGEVQFNPGPLYLCAKYGGFGVLDEINMARSEAVSVLHAITDDRKVIDVPGYERIKLNPATRFIGTMNYGYVGTREMNEALVSRFLIISVPEMHQNELVQVLKMKFPKAKTEMLQQFAGVFIDLQKKAKNAEISTKAVDLRGIIAALKTIQRGLKPKIAMKMGVVNKAFDEYERQIVQDTVDTRIRDTWEMEDVFDVDGTISVDFGSVK